MNGFFLLHFSCYLSVVNTAMVFFRNVSNLMGICGGYVMIDPAAKPVVRVAKPNKDDRASA